MHLPESFTLRGQALRWLFKEALHGVVQSAFIDTLLRTHLLAYPGHYGEMLWVLMMMEQ
jgi:asparagine synthase (glutamine-hydrolysing)